MKKLFLYKSACGYWKPKESLDSNMELLWSFFADDSIKFLEYSLEFLQKNKDWESAGGDAIDLRRHDGQITLSYEFEEDGPSFTIKESELEKILVGWLKLVKSGAKEIMIESQDDEHYTITGK